MTEQAEVAELEQEEEITADESAAENKQAEDRGDDFEPEAGTTEKEVLNAEDLAELAGEETDQHRIPKARFDEVNNAKKRAEEDNTRLLAEIEELRKLSSKPAVEADTAAEPTVTIASLEQDYINAMMEGDTEKALKIRSQINTEIEQQSTKNALAQFHAETARATTEKTLNEAAGAMIAKYPALDDKSENANQEAIDEASDLITYYVQVKGMNGAEAIQKAATQVARMYGLEEAGIEAATEKTGADGRTKAAIKRGIDVSTRQPNTAAVGVGTRQDAGKSNIDTMTEEQFEALPESEKRKMRGD